MKLSSIISELQLNDPPVLAIGQDCEVIGVTHDSRNLSQGEIFVALTGGNFDGHEHIPDAIMKGAIAIIGEKALESINPPYIQVSNSRLALAKVAGAFYGYPAKQLNVIGVTGTDGKTTTASLIHHILSDCGVKAGMVSTVNARIGDEEIDTGFHVTTPEAQKIQSLLRKMVDAGLTHVVLEATSHGLEQFRVAECYFDVGVITNITHEHFDYHGDYAHYLKSKSRLLTGLGHGVRKPDIHNPVAILNMDDISYQPLQEILNTQFSDDLHVVTYGTEDGCELRAENVRNLRDGLAFDLVMDGKHTEVRSTMIGEYNFYNILAAVGAAHFGCGIAIKDIAGAIQTFPGVPGRMEEFDLGQSFTAIVDFAHTPNALKVALETSRNRTKNKVIAVFGSAGLRDREKRRMMAATSARLADITVITAEDPRTEDLDFILSEMRDEAVKHGGVEGVNLYLVPDRGEAIKKAVSLAEAGDLVISCGKGHEQSMCFGEIEYPWDDRIALQSALASLLHIPGPEMPYLPTQN